MAASSVAELRIALARGSHSAEASRPIVSSGIAALNRILPAGGYQAGTLVEWLAPIGSGVADLAFRSLPAALPQSKIWCVVEAANAFCPWPTLAGTRGPDCLVVRATAEPDRWWAVEQALRCPGVALTWCWADRTPDRVLRRWQLAAEAGGGIGMLFRPPEARRHPSWADLRLSATPLVQRHSTGRTVRIEVLYSRGRLEGQAAVLELHHATGAVRVASQLAHSATAAREPEAPAAPARRVC
ncbi:MAG TPA: hypothetical protein VM165_16440 [Planctomycetaceae bacterium]|nr:hypothetical protein [Planctomycetaceae bacterium]